MAKKKKRGKYFNPQVDCAGLNKLWKKIKCVKYLTGSSHTSRVSDVIQYYGYEVPQFEHDRVELVNKIIFNRTLQGMTDGQRVKVYQGKVKPRVDKVDATKSDFYRSSAWSRLRYEALRGSSGQCELCGAKPSPENGVSLQVDHIKPRSKFPELALDISNTQVLCATCNVGKSNIYVDDWRDEEECSDTLTEQFIGMMQ